MAASQVNCEVSAGRLEPLNWLPLDRLLGSEELGLVGPFLASLFKPQAICHLLKNEYFIFSLVGFKGNLSLAIYLFFRGLKQMEAIEHQHGTRAGGLPCTLEVLDRFFVPPFFNTRNLGFFLVRSEHLESPLAW